MAIIEHISSMWPLVPPCSKGPTVIHLTSPLDNQESELAGLVPNGCLGSMEGRGLVQC